MTYNIQKTIFLPKKSTSKSQLQVKYMQSNCSLFSRLYIGCKGRGADLTDFFKHENQPFPPSLSEYGKLRFGKKI